MFTFGLDFDMFGIIINSVWGRRALGVNIRCFQSVHCAHRNYSINSVKSVIELNYE